MSTNLTFDPTTFKLVRPALVVNGLTSPVDPYVAKELNALQDKLSRKFMDSNFIIEGTKDENALTLSLDALITKITDLGSNIGGAVLSTTASSKAASSSSTLFRFGDLIDKKGNTDLLYQVSELIETSRLLYNTSKLLSFKGIKEYLFAKAAYHLNLNTAPAIFKFMTNDVDGGIKLMYDFIAVKAAVNIKNDHKFETGSNDAFLKKITPKLKVTNISFAEGKFTPAITTIIKELIFDKDEFALINGVKEKLNITDEDIPALINYIKNSHVKIVENNAEFFLSIALNDIKNSGISFTTTTTTDITDSDFSVTYYEDEKGALEVVRENILCAAQLYFVMTIGDELEVFNVINRIITKYLPSGQIDIRSRETLNNLQLYVFNDSFKDIKTGIEYKRTHPEERKMFYKQVFSAGNGETIDGMLLNSDFNSLWEKLLVESVKYIEKVEQSTNPTLFVSRQNIFQAVEDLQYNLSTHCTGMAKVAAPIINKELDFVVERFLKNEELTKQLAFNNSTSFWKVVERVLADLRGSIPNVSTLRSKAVFGHKILTTVANYTPAFLDDDKNFSEFISTVEAFIIANSELENSQNTSNLYQDEEQPGYRGPSYTPGSGRSGNPSMNGPSAEGNEWNF